MVFAFKAEFVIAWPIWAGGYPIQANALRALNKKKKVLVTTLEERLHSLLDVGFSIDELNYRIGGYSAIFGLFPSDYPPNSLILQMSVNAYPQILTI